ncbi:MAG: hypothetical protein QXK89_10655 [Candidatus Bathyarchaeia archaeon]
MQVKNQHQSFALPYIIIEDADQEARITPEAEVAAIFCLALQHRRKTGIIMGRIENLRSISKAYYPLIYIPCADKCAIIDGLGFSRTTLLDRNIPDASHFTETIRKSRVSPSLFIEALSDGATLFSKPLKEEKKKWEIEYLISDTDLVKSLSSFIWKLKPIKEPSSEKDSIIPFRISISEAEESAKKVFDLWRRLKVEVSMLAYTLQFLEDEVNYHNGKLSKESEQILSEYKRQMSDLEVRVNERIKQIIKQKEKEIKRIQNVYKKKAGSILKEKDKINRAIYRTEQLLERKLKRKRKGKRVRKADLENEIKFYERKIESLRERIRDLQRIEEKNSWEERHAIKEVEEKYDSLINSERERLEVLREARDVEMARINEANKRIKSVYVMIENQLKKIIEEKESLIRVIEEAMLPLRASEPMMVGVPFYIIKYESRGESRLDFLSPVKVTGLSGTLRKTGGDFSKLNIESRFSSILKPLSETLNNMISRDFNRLIGGDEYLRRKIEIIVESENILKRNNFVEILGSGLEKLEFEGWINSEEKSAIIKLLESL